jgi:predicted small lipoprotein YifL
MTRSLMLIAAVLALALAGPVACGKRGQLEPPADKPSTYPRSYPAN